MLNLGMTEIFCFAIIALLVLGPDKLPEAARFAAKWYGKIKRFISTVQNEIDRELKLSEFRDEMQKEIEKITELERRMQQQLEVLKNKTAALDAENTDQPPETQPTLTYIRVNSVFDHTTPFSIAYQKKRIELPVISTAENQQKQDLKIAV